MDHLEEAAEILSQVQEDQSDSADVAAAQAALDLANQSAAVGDLSGLEAAITANPSDHQARFDLAIGLFGAGRREDAIDHLVEIMKMDRSWNEEAARKQLIKFFDAMSPTDDANCGPPKDVGSLVFMNSRGIR